VRAVQELSLARDLATIQEIVRIAAREITSCDGATFVLRDNGFCFYADEDAIAPLWKGKRFPLEICVSGWAMLNRKPAVISDIYADNRIPHEAYRPTFVKSLVMVPIRSMNPIGAIGNYWATPYEPTAAEVELLQSLADSTAIALENVQVYSELEARVQMRTAELQKAKEEIEQLSLTDDLTGLNNRRGFYMQATRALAWIARQQKVSTLAFIDVDGLKGVNDQLGHDAGDCLISDLASVLRAICRESDVVGRLGGDEFCVLLVNPDSTDEGFSFRLQSAIRDFNSSQIRPYQLAASVGVAYVCSDEPSGLDELLARADYLMYTEKRAKVERQKVLVNESRQLD
jgi:diguanylate cyclase (GGDEF)-like protein